MLSSHHCCQAQERIHRTLGIPEPFGEGLYVLNYQIGQKYDAHNDHVMDGSAWQKARNNVRGGCPNGLALVRVGWLVDL